MLSMLNSAEHNINHAHVYQNTNNCWYFNIYKHDKYNIWEFESKKSIIFSVF